VKHPFFSADFCCAFKSQSFVLEIHEQTITAEGKQHKKNKIKASERENRQIACPRNFAIIYNCGMEV
jgi:hypothetical protein